MLPDYENSWDISAIKNFQTSSIFNWKLPDLETTDVYGADLDTANTNFIPQIDFATQFTEEEGSSGAVNCFV